MFTIKNIILKNLGISYLKRLFRVTNGPTYASLFFTRKCNFNCSYCATSDGNEIPEFTTIGAALALAGAGLYVYRKRK